MPKQHLFCYNRKRMSEKKHLIKNIIANSIADEWGLVASDALLTVNGELIEDIFDYQYQCENTDITVTVMHIDGTVSSYEAKKDEDEDLGIVFEDGLMDEYRHCSNKCIFCFIDQMPPGMRDTLYFKDDDARLSFLQGNYITLTNMSDHDIDRIIKYRLSPINVSFQTMNPDLRCKMLNNRFAGDALLKVKKFYDAGIELNGQIVLCKGVNDKEELEYSISELYKYLPVIRSVSIVPVGLTKFREGLYPLEPFEKDDADEVIDMIEKWQKKAYDEFGVHFVHASDEWYIIADREVPEEERYDGYLQIENGVGMVRNMLTEFEDALSDACEKYLSGGLIRNFINHRRIKDEKITVVTGKLVAPYIEKMMNRLQEEFPQKKIETIAIRNDFFGERITVTGLLTSRDIIAQCKELGEIGDRLLIPECVLRAGTDVFLDDLTVSDVESALHSKISIVKSNGYDAMDCYLGVGDYRN